MTLPDPAGLTELNRPSAEQNGFRNDQTGSTWNVDTGQRRGRIVGTALVGVNMGAELAAGEADGATALRILANCAIPYLVSSIGYLGASTRDETGRLDAQASAGGGQPQ